MKILTREEFRDAVMLRDGFDCIVPTCPKAAKDAHHIMERRLWAADENEGYFVDNGASVCEDHHNLAERIIPTAIIRKWCGIPNIVLPKILDPSKDYDKWGTPLKMPTREYIKYPSTPYLPFSESIGNPITNIKLLLGMPLLVTIKMDGSNACITKDKIAARNGQYADHTSFDLLKTEHIYKRSTIPENLQVFGEWLYAKHSIHYKDNLSLSSRFQIFNIYDVNLRCFLGWDEVKDIAKCIDYPTVPIVAENISIENEWEFTSTLSRMARKVIESGHEGIVIRPMIPFHYGHFEICTGKYVRANHVQTDNHWKDMHIVKNEVKK